MKKSKKPNKVYWYEADHAFANTGGDYYDKESAEMADTRTFSFFEKFLTD